MERVAHYVDHIGPVGWMFVGAGVMQLVHEDWLVGSVLILMTILATEVAHEKSCLREEED